MGVDTKGVVVTKVKDVMLIAGLATCALERLIRQGRNEQFPGVRGWPARVREQFTSIKAELSLASSMVLLNFRCYGEERCINLYFECDCDHKDLGEASVSLSMGYWGHSETYAQAILHAWSLLGATYIDVNDSDMDDMTPLETEGITLLQAVALDYVTPYAAEHIVEKFKAGELPVDHRTFDAFVGAAEPVWRDLMTESETKARWDRMEALAHERYPNEEALPAVRHMAVALAA